MNTLEWTTALSVGVEEIDDQHQRLISIINRLIEARDGAPGSEDMFAILKDLVDYSDYHFRTEDDYMMENQYPLFLSHRKEHLAYIKKMGVLVSSLENKDPNLPEEMLAYLIKWWRDHITQSDLRYARYIKAQKIEKAKRS